MEIYIYKGTVEEAENLKRNYIKKMLDDPDVNKDLKNYIRDEKNVKIKSHWRREARYCTTGFEVTASYRYSYSYADGAQLTGRVVNGELKDARIEKTWTDVKTEKTGRFFINAPSGNIMVESRFSSYNTKHPENKPFKRVDVQNLPVELKEDLPVELKEEVGNQNEQECISDGIIQAGFF